MKRLARWVALSVILAIGVTTGCTVHPRLSQDDSVRILVPRSAEQVSLPLKVVWKARSASARYAVFFDRPPMATGAGLRSLVPSDDRLCKVRPDCPDETWLQGRSIYVTGHTSIRLTTLPDLRSNDHSKDRHEMTIVLLDETGHRVGDSAFVREFIIERDAA